MIIEISDTAGYCGSCDYLLPRGTNMTPEELEDSEEPLLVILSNDSFVRVHEYQRVACGGSMLSETSEQWFYTKTDLPSLPEFYAFMSTYLTECKKIIEGRKMRGLAFKRLQSFLGSFPRQLFEDHDVTREVLALGLAGWVEENCDHI